MCAREGKKNMVPTQENNKGEIQVILTSLVIVVDLIKSYMNSGPKHLTGILFTKIRFLMLS